MFALLFPLSSAPSCAPEMTQLTAAFKYPTAGNEEWKHKNLSFLKLYPEINAFPRLKSASNKAVLYLMARAEMLYNT
jgi:hypothetical protein